MKYFLKQFISFVQKGYPKKVLLILLLFFLIGILITLLTSYIKKSDIEQKFSQREVIVNAEYDKKIKDYNKKLEDYNSLINLSPTDYFEKTGKIKGTREARVYNIIAEPLHPDFGGRNFKSEDRELNSLRKIKDMSFISSWLTSKLTIVFLLILLVSGLMPIFFRISIIAASYGKRQILIITQMTTFQKYLIVLIFCTLILLSLILIKVF